MTDDDIAKRETAEETLERIVGESHRPGFTRLGPYAVAITDTVPSPALAV